MESKLDTSRSKEAAVQRIADAHYLLEEGITDIYRVLSPANEDDLREPIKLLEVNRNGIPVGVMPLYFGVGKRTPFPSVIMDVTPEEFAEISSDRLRLPEDWTLGPKLPRPSEN